MPFLTISLVVLATSGLLLWLIRPQRWLHSGWLAALPPLAVTGWLFTQLGAVSAGHFLAESFAWAPQIGLEISFRLDGLALFFGLIIAGVGAAVALYTGYYFERDERQGYFYLLLFLFMASMLGLVWADNLLALFVFWEGTSITSYLLIAFNHQDRAAREGGRRALIVTGLGGLALLAGFVLLGQSVGSYSIHELLRHTDLPQQPLYPAALLLILVGAFTKSAQFPFHFWLPGAMAAPTPASAYLHAATMVKAGIFLLARLHPVMADSPLWFWSLFGVGAITMLLGAVSALRYYDLKAVLANATVSQLGVLVMLLAFRSEKVYVAAVVGILAHALYKGPLFLVAGIVDHATGSRDMRDFAGLWRTLPWVALTAVLACLSMAGIPPSFGFLAKETLLESYYQLVEADPGFGRVAFGMAWLTGALFVAYSLTLIWATFFRNRATSDEPAHVHHPPVFGFVAAPLALTLIGTAIPFALPAVERLVLSAPATSIAGRDMAVHLKLWHGFTPVLLASLLAIAAGIGIFFVRHAIRRGLQTLPRGLNGVAQFNTVNDAIYDFANWVTRVVQGGTMSQQASVTMLALFSVVAMGLWLELRSVSVQLMWTARPEPAEALIALLAGIAAFGTVYARTRLSAIISLGVVGVTVVLYFIFFSAPDLALTQLLIEVLTVVLLVLVFFLVKPDRLPPVPRSRRLRDLSVAMAMGFFGFTLVFLSNSVQIGESISGYFLYHSVPEGHGSNVVNVILVDFRGYDTLGEITVLGIAAVGGFALLRAPRMRALRSKVLARRARVERAAKERLST